MRPHWQLTRTVFEIPGSWPTGPEPRFNVELWLENLGGSTAPAAYANVFYPGLGWIEEPHTGRTTIRVGEFLKLRKQLPQMQTDIPTGWLGRRRYMQGDDVFWDLRGVQVEVHWGPSGRYTEILSDIHSQQLMSPVLDNLAAYPDRRP